MSIYNKNNKFVSYLIVLISLFILVLFTKNIIKDIYQNKDLRETYRSTLKEKETKLNTLNDLKAKMSSDLDEVNKYNVEVKENELVDYIYWYIDRTNGRDWFTYIKSVNITKSVENELWFKETNIDLNLRVPSEEVLVKILDFLVSSKSKYNFYLTSLSFPYWKENAGYLDVTIPLKLLQSN